MADAARLINLGMAEPTANELATQIAAQTGDVSRLVGVAVEPLLAQQIVTQIDAGPADADGPVLVDHGMMPEMAVEVAAQITADRP